MRWDELIIRCEWKTRMIKYGNEKSVLTQKNIGYATETIPCSFDEILLESISTQINIDSIRA